ncbi:hypothetical protein BDV95DRAFT_611747 [Massariosphaeria phaeospora]|uniref:Uncharacterized protein n=1 Tax=Massariosphaeria phaeospora TaxID=100035 RepID=A0A7C8M5G8_9PLEO|nr:hypothetical protein BDV95DRAFT_611747 [Massariosphaeria phaeospora]
MASLAAAFAQLAITEGLSRKSRAYHDRRSAFYVQAFESEFGTSATDLEAWQAFCREVGATPGLSITKCKKALKGIHVNLINLLGHRYNPTVVPLIRFESFAHFRAYTRKHIFPKKKAKEDSFLKVLLRQIL